MPHNTTLPASAAPTTEAGHEAHWGDHNDYACQLSGPHCWTCNEPWPCRASRGIETQARADTLDQFRQAIEAIRDTSSDPKSSELAASILAIQSPDDAGEYESMADYEEHMAALGDPDLERADDATGEDR